VTHQDPDPAQVAAWEQVGAQLRAARERAGLTLEDISARTKIKVLFLAALEQGQVELLPPGPFARGFARAYAVEVGLDPSDVLKRLTPLPWAATRPSPPAQPATWPEVAWGRRTSWGVVAASILLALALLLRGEDDSGREAEVRDSVGTVSERAAAEQEPPPPRPEPLPAEGTKRIEPLAGTTTPVAPITFDLHAIGEVWVEAVADGRRAAYELLPPGGRRTFKAERELVLRVGDAAAIEYVINGVPGVPLGRSGEVREVRVTPDGVAAFQAREATPAGTETPR
jgi:transcriptional regulator with XRE-family HTH domain